MKKLVRDRIPEIVESEGRRYKIDKCQTNADKIIWLKEKLIEESFEFVQSEELQELGDILDVIQALMDVSHWNPQALKSMRKKKAIEKGLFEEGYIMDFEREIKNGH